MFGNGNILICFRIVAVIVNHPTDCLRAAARGLPDRVSPERLSRKGVAEGERQWRGRRDNFAIIAHFMPTGCMPSGPQRQSCCLLAPDYYACPWCSSKGPLPTSVFLGGAGVGQPAALKVITHLSTISSEYLTRLCFW